MMGISRLEYQYHPIACSVLFAARLEARGTMGADQLASGRTMCWSSQKLIQSAVSDDCKSNVTERRILTTRH
jgi:hypothetical protein